MYLRHLISFTIIGLATFVVLYLFFQEYSMSYIIATSVVVGAVYTFLVSFGDKFLYRGIMKKLLDKKNDKKTKK